MNLFLVLPLLLLSSPFALRPLGPGDNAGLEEELRARLEDPLTIKMEFTIRPRMNEFELQAIENQVRTRFPELGRSPLFSEQSQIQLDEYLFVGERGTHLEWGKTISLTDVIHNALDAMADRADRLRRLYRGKITAWVGRTQQGWWAIEIRDNGIGIRSSVLQKLFLEEVSTKPSIMFYKRLGGVGTAILKGGLGDSFLKQFEGMIQIEALRSSLVYDTTTGAITISPRKRSQVGTTIRWIFKQDPTRRSAGLEEAVAQIETVLGGFPAEPVGAEALSAGQEESLILGEGV